MPSIPGPGTVPAGGQGAAPTTWTLVPVVLMDGGRHCSLANVYFTQKGKKTRKKAHCEFKDQSYYWRGLYIFSQGPVIRVLVGVMCEMHRGVLIFRWNCFDKSRQMRVRKVNEKKSPSMKLRNLLTQRLCENTFNLDRHPTRGLSNFHRYN